VEYTDEQIEGIKRAERVKTAGRFRIIYCKSDYDCRDARCCKMCQDIALLAGKIVGENQPKGGIKK